MKILPQNAHGYILYPIISHTDENGEEVYFEGVIEITEEEFDGVTSQTHRFSDDLKSVVKMSETEAEDLNASRRQRQEVGVIEEQIQIAKNELASTDYMALKHLDGEYSDEEWQEIVKMRKELREKVRELESQRVDYVVA